MESALCTLLSALVVLLCSSPECKGEDTVTQPEGDASVFKGHTATINCIFDSGSTNPTLFWYKKDKDDPPKCISAEYRAGGSWIPITLAGLNTTRFTNKIEGNSSALNIQDVRVSDSAVYYCALRPTVTGNTKL
uniref:Ig-like domain-containing protein n=1 Tax=Neogobius melanostomus TaxID=47308 RepID=A0A8C6TJG3_9GOBI